MEPGDRVTLYGPNCWEWLVAYYAIAKSGAVVNPISSMLTADEVRYVVEDSGARVVVTSSDKGAPLLDLIEAGELSHVVLWGDESRRLRARRSLTVGRGRPTRVRTGRTRDPSRPRRNLLHVRDDRSSEGRDAEHRSVIGAAVGTVVMGARGPGDRVINSLPLPHVYGSCVFNAAMMAGSTLIMVPRFDAGTVLAAIARASGDADGRRPDRVLLPARPSRTSTTPTCRA